MLLAVNQFCAEHPEFEGNSDYNGLAVTYCQGGVMQYLEKESKEGRMTDSKVRVSIGMPVYNEERHLEQALQSLLSQSVEDFELIISDNASTDRTREICLAYAAKDPRVRYHRTETNLGAIVNFNRVFRLSDAAYFIWASGHDIRHETFIARCIELLERDASVVLCYPTMRWLEPDGHLGDVISSRMDTRGMSQVSCVHTVLWGDAYPIYGIIRSDALKRTGLMRNTVGPDVVLLAELAFLGAFAEVPEPLLCIRRLSDFGSWTHYLVKSLGPLEDRRSAWYLYSKWIYEHLRVVARHARNSRDKAVLLLSVIFCILTKYRWVLRGLLRAHPRSSA
jgi:glycosyltransferase involved in cell wall biosynthesis